jgi:hypothetical protein
LSLNEVDQISWSKKKTWMKKEYFRKPRVLRVGGNI